MGERGSIPKVQGRTNKYMYNIATLFGDILTTKDKPRSERNEMIGFFINEINKERPCTYKDKNSKWKTIKKIETPKEEKKIAVMLGVFKKKEELEDFYKVCLDYKNRHGSFSKRFYGGFKEQKF